MRVVDPTLPRYGTDLMTLQNELLQTLCRGWDLDFLCSRSRFSETVQRACFLDKRFV